MSLPASFPAGPLYHLLFETLAYLSGFSLFRWLKARQGDFLAEGTRWSLIAAAVLGAVVGSKLLHHLANPSLWPQYAERPVLLLAGKTIVGALIGGWGAVEGAKRWLGIPERTGDLYVAPLLLGIAVGRIGCFLSGLADGTYGVPTSLPWGVDFGDGLARHPTQLYEIAFLGVLALVLYRPGLAPDRGDRFRAFVLAYLAFRLVIDFLKPYDRVMGLNPIQLSCLAVLLLCLSEWPRLLRTFAGAGRP
ncbi:MAG: prolipoprotein diacylglyceryl transferase [Acidobacteria bacterium]|nr:prolipoprotein diacylglyceryl transferase [Acidobacteriota bacterium]